MVKTSKNILVKAAGLMLGATMLMASVLGGTMAKYSSKHENLKAAVTAATWEIKVGKDDSTGTKLEELSNLDFLTWTIDGDSNGSQDPSTLAEQKKIAPDTWGYASIVIKNSGEVDAQVKITQSSKTSTDNSGLTLAIFDAEQAPENSGAISDKASNLADPGVSIPAGQSKTVYVGYTWAYGSGSTDQYDTQLAGTEISFGTLTIQADQDGFTQNG